MSTEQKKSRNRGSDNKATETSAVTLSNISDILSEKLNPISDKIDGFISQLTDTQEKLEEIT